MSKFKVGDLVVPADGGSYIGEVIYVSEEEDVVRHKCRATGVEYEKSYFGFPARYMTIPEVLGWHKKFSAENIQLHQQVIQLTLRAETAEANFARVREELRLALDGREREYQRAEEALEQQTRKTENS